VGWASDPLYQPQEADQRRPRLRYIVVHTGGDKIKTKT
jgi:hypothetical protein